MALGLLPADLPLVPGDGSAWARRGGGGRGSRGASSDGGWGRGGSGSAGSSRGPSASGGGRGATRDSAPERQTAPPEQGGRPVKAGGPRPAGTPLSSPGAARPAAVGVTAGLPTPGPERRRKLDAGFADHDQRVRTFETLARALDLPPEVGAFQADFGTPGESGLAQALADLDALRAALAASPDDAALAAEVADHERALEALLDGLPNGGEGWARADLDVNDDGRVDGGDLEAARAAGLPVERGPDDERPGPDGGAGPSGDGGPSGPGPGRFVPAAGGS